MSSGPHYAAGRYLCQIVDQGLTKASTGTVQIVLKFKVIEGTQPVQKDLQQYERTAYLPVTERTMEYLGPKLEAIGYTRDSFRHLDLKDPQCHDMRGNQNEFYCQHESKQDGSGMREKWDVASLQAASGPLELKPPDPKELRQLDMLFGRHRKNTATPKAKPVSVQAAGSEEPPPTQWANDDIPF